MYAGATPGCCLPASQTLGIFVRQSSLAIVPDLCLMRRQKFSHCLTCPKAWMRSNRAVCRRFHCLGVLSEMLHMQRLLLFV